MVDKVQDDCRSSAIPWRDRATACGSLLIRTLRRPLTAYLVVMTIASISFAVLSHHTDEQLSRQDIQACQSRNNVLRQANKNTQAMLTVIATLVDGDQVGTYQEFAGKVKQYKLTDCSKLRK